MPEEALSFRYLAFDPTGRKVKGVVSASDDRAAFQRLRRDGLSPIRLSPARGSSNDGRALAERDLAAFLADLAALLGAGADLRAALAILSAKSSANTVRAFARTLTREVSGGEALEAALSRNLGPGRAYIGALVAAGEAAGDLASGFSRAAAMLEARIRLRDQMVSVLSYPGFVLASSIVALAVILLFVIPTLAPLVEDAGAKPPAIMAFLIGASELLRRNAVVLLGSTCLSAALVAFFARAGLLTRPFERVLLDGPVRRTFTGLAYGSFSIALGEMLSAGAPMSDALRLALRSVRQTTARDRLAPVAHAVRQGVSLPSALERVKGFPTAIVRLAAVGEASGALGAMIARAGRLEESAAVRRIEAFGRILGPALIVLLGGLIGLLMAGLLSGVSRLGETALQ